MSRQRFSIRFDLTSKVLAPEGIKWKNYRFSRRWSIINIVFDIEIRKLNWNYVVRLVEPVRNMCFLTLSQFQNLTSGQVKSRSVQDQIMTQVGQYTHTPKRLDEPSRLAPFARLYLHPVATYWRKTVWPQVTSFDPRWPPRDTRSSVVPRSSQMGWVAVILK